MAKSKIHTVTKCLSCDYIWSGVQKNPCIGSLRAGYLNCFCVRWLFFPYCFRLPPHFHSQLYQTQISNLRIKYSFFGTIFSHKLDYRSNVNSLATSSFCLSNCCFWEMKVQCRAFVNIKFRINISTAIAVSDHSN